MEPEYKYVKGEGWVPVQAKDYSIWVSADGRRTPLTQMTNDHLANAWRKMNREAQMMESYGCIKEMLKYQCPCITCNQDVYDDINKKQNALSAELSERKLFVSRMSPGR